MSFQLEINHVNESKRSVQEAAREGRPSFVDCEPDFDFIESKTAEEYENLIIIGNGGSITSFRAFYYAFLPEVEKDVRIVTTPDPDYLNRISKETSSDDTLVLAISKSGETVTVLESLLYFLKRNYDAMTVTCDNDGALKQVTEKKDFDWIPHQQVGGRFSGLTETALFPAHLAGMDVREIRKGAENMYEKLSPKKKYNPALNAASALFDAEKQGFNQVFAGFYSSRMMGFKPLLVQLMHETVCKENKGQTVFGDMGPEFQHHTNQRLFGGRKDIIPIFFTTDNHEREHIEVEKSLRDVRIRERGLGELNDMEMKKSLKSEYKGVVEALDDQERPYMNFNLTNLSYKGAGKMMAFLQYFAVYSAYLRDLNPFNQPDVEKSKKLGFKARFR